MKRVLAGFMMITVLMACDTGDNEQIRINAEDIYRYDHFTFKTQGCRGCGDDAGLVFTNMRTRARMEWKGGPQDAMVYLETLQKGRCYKLPVTRGQTKEVPCG